MMSDTEVTAHGIVARTLRLRRGMTLDQLAEATGLSKGHLSRFERGEKSLSIAAMMRVAGALGASVSKLLGEHVDEDVFHLVRRGDRTMRKAAEDDGGYAFAVLSRAEQAGGPNAFVVDIEAHSRRVSDAFHAGEEILFVLAGAIDVELGDRKLSLAEGDYLQFPGHLRHVVHGRGERNQVLIVVSGQQAPAVRLSP